MINKINKLTVLKSGLSFNQSNNNKYISLEAIGYKHLAIQNSEQWEYVYPRIEYNISDIDENIFKGRLSIKNQFDFTMIITHLDTIKDYMDSLIPIEVKNGISKVTYH